MVVENPLTDEQQDALDAALEEIITGSHRDVSVSTDDDEFDYKATLKEVQTGPRMRSVVLHLVWHDDKTDWEIAKREDKAWRS